LYSEDQARRGQEVYERECLECHSRDLSGAGFAGPLVGEAVRAGWEDRSLGNVYAVIRSSMPYEAPASLSQQEYVDVLAYILEKNGYPSGPEELPLDRALLDRSTFGRN
jgi:mono/diheme cytochrome c family protein